MDLSKQLDTAISTIQYASKIIMKIYHDDFVINVKEDHSFVTNADIESNQYISKSLLTAFPEYGILTEESKLDNQRLTKDFCWIVDPLDGTKDFVNRTDNFSINIALAYQHKIVLGVIAVPVKNIIYYATLNQGAFKIENGVVSRIHVSNKTRDLTMVVSQFFFKDENKFSAMPQIKQLIPCGSSYKAGLIAEGKAEFCIKEDNHTKEWDTAPSEILLHEAGGIMTDLYGNLNFYNKENVVNENGFLIANSLEVLNLFKK